jgi:hypothetical protein
LEAGGLCKHVYIYIYIYIERERERERARERERERERELLELNVLLVHITSPSSSFLPLEESMDRFITSQPGFEPRSHVINVHLCLTISNVFDDN